ncbi:hypothetical protein HN51_045986 [Arachis hypogaea]|uniref:uncharacterized protein n=1 Tax=Arachis hypogaea TaxID=3818 RepID=UPI000DEDBAF8|nr:uncharacterized protein LOC112772645 [Arachis hypogaea]QHN98250.1 Chaperone protein dnaJ [Arachis hypogaea]
MECNKDDAIKAKELAEKTLLERDLSSAKIFAKKAQDMYPNLDGLRQLLATIEVYASAEKKVNGEVDWYRVLGVEPMADDQTIRRHYRKLALILHPDKNKSVGADEAFNLITQAWTCLSDNAKRVEYDQKRNFSGIYCGKPSAPARPSGFFGNLNAANWKNRDQGSATHQTQTTRPPTSMNPTFWTMCLSCRTKFEYNAHFVNCKLTCFNCNKTFVASEASPPRVYRNASSTSSISQMNQNNLNRMRANCHVLGKVPIPAVNSSFGSGSLFMPGGISRMPSFSTAAETPGVFKVPSDTLKRACEASTPDNALAAEKTGVAGSTFHSCSFGSNSSLKGDGPRKKIRTSEFKVNSDRKYTQNGVASRHEGVSLANELGSEKDNSETGRMSAAGNYKRNVFWEIPQQKMKKILMEKARKEIQKKLEEWNVASEARNLEKSKYAATEIIEKDKKKAKDVIEKENKKITYAVKPDTKNAIRGAKPGAQGIVASDKIGKKHIPPADPVVADYTVLMSVPDPDFHDFDGDRIENAFGANQVWAVYDEDDGMPRYYALIHDVISKKPFNMRISWLNSKTNDELAPIEWVSSGFPKTSGDFRISKHVVYNSLNSFSHKVQWTKGARGIVHIYPKKGDVWALYRNWSADWNQFTKDEVIHKYDMVEVLEDYNEKQGVNVAPLGKVQGFKTVFCRNRDPRRIKNIPKAEMFRLSHQVPAYLLTGQEGHNAPRGCLELDPAATPMELLQVVTEIPEQESVDEFQSKENPGRDEKSRKIKQDSAQEIPRKEGAEAIGKKDGKPDILYVYRRRHLREKRAM